MAVRPTNRTADVASLRVEVDNLSDAVRSIRTDMHGLREAMSTRQDMESLSAQIQSIAQKQDTLGQPRYSLLISVVSVGIAILGMLGALAYWPIRQETGDLKAALITLSEKALPQRQYESDLARTANALAELRHDSMTKVQQQRYNTDQERLTSILDDFRNRFAPKIEVSKNAEDINQLRTRSYDQNGRTSKLEADTTNLNARLDAISRRLAEFIRDMGKH